MPAEAMVPALELMVEPQTVATVFPIIGADLSLVCTFFKDFPFSMDFKSEPFICEKSKNVHVFVMVKWEFYWPILLN